MKDLAQMRTVSKPDFLKAVLLATKHTRRIGHDRAQ
jgi:hypothetical protein